MANSPADPTAKRVVIQETLDLHLLHQHLFPECSDSGGVNAFI